MTDSRAKYAFFEMASRKGVVPTRAESVAGLHNPLSEASVSGQSALEGAQMSSMAPDRLNVGGDFFPPSTSRNELLLTLSSSKLLTELICAVINGPTGPADVDVLDRLVAESHRLADGWARQIVGDGKDVPGYLRANLLKQACRFLASNWQRHGQIDAQRVLDLAAETFSSQVASIDQALVVQLDSVPDVAPDTLEQARQQIQATCSMAYWKLVNTVSSISAIEFGLAGLVEDDQDRFVYGLKIERVASDLLEHVLLIADENRIETPDRVLAVSWYRNAINRLTSLVSANYRAITRMVLADIDSSSSTAAAQVHAHFQMYEQVLQRTHEFSRQQFINAEAVATEKMSGSAFVKYLQSGDSTNHSRPSANESVSASAEQGFKFGPSEMTPKALGDGAAINAPRQETHAGESPVTRGFKYSF